MSNFDDILQSKLDALENGQPLEAVLRDLPSEMRELEALIRLAAAVRSVPHPEPLAAHLDAQRQQVMTTARLNTRPVPRPRPNRTVWNWFGTFGMAGAAATLVLGLVLFSVGMGFWWSNRSVRSVRVEHVTGQAQVATNPAGTAWKNINAGDRLVSGQRVRTLGASSATLVFYEGTRTRLDANADLTLTQVGRAGSALHVELTQNSGETANQVVPFNPAQGSFLVHTPSGTASVHGTTFNVKVNQNGQSLFAVNKGEVRVSNNAGQVTLLSGQATTAGISGALAAPNYQFNVTGSLLAIQGDTWIVSGVPFKVSADTLVEGEPDLGSTVRVTGRVLWDGTRMADSIEPAGDSDQNASFTGTLESMTGEEWQISGTSVKVTGDTDLDADLAIGSPVKVTFNLLEDGTWLALKVESLVELPQQPTPVPSATADAQAVPSFSFVPDEVESATCDGQNSYNLTGSLRNTAGDAKNDAANVQLGYLIDRGGEYVSLVELSPSGWSRINAGQTMPFNIHITTTPGFASQNEDAEIKLRVFIASASNSPDPQGGRLTVTVKAGCKATATPTLAPSLTATAEATAAAPVDGTPAVTATPEISPTAQPAQTNQCTGADPQPTGLKLAQRYNVSYEEIMGWFCQHYGFGEIDLAYSLSRQSGKAVEEIFAMRANGEGWGNIKKQVAPEYQPADTNNKNNNGNDNKDKDKNDKDKNKDKGKKDK